MHLAAIFPAFLLLASPVLSGSVFEVSDQDFYDYLKDKTAMIIDFYVPWCSDCKRLAPEFEAAAEALAKKKKFVFGRMDCEGKGINTCKMFGIHSWPQVKVFKHGQYAGEYQGNQDRASIASFMDDITKNDGPVVGQFPYPQVPQVGFQGQAQGAWPQPGWYKSRIFGKRKQK